jgi:hypothetical protein
MGDAATLLTLWEARHLLRRSGFGALPDEVRAIMGRPRGAVVDDLLDFKPSRFAPYGDDVAALHNFWLRDMLRPRVPRRGGPGTAYLRKAHHALQEKLVLFWHDHFATNLGYVAGIAQQNQLFRLHCKGNLRDFVKAMNKNPLLMGFLGTNRNFKWEPNENYARELMELFTLGVADFAGNPNYVQQDIVQIARAFTGWGINLNPLMAFLDESRHDFMAEFPARGAKVIFQQTGGFGPQGRSFVTNGEGAAEIDTIIDLIFEHRDSENRNTVARYIANKLLTYFAHPQPAPAVVDELVDASAFDTAFDLQSLLRALFVHDAFYASAAPAWTGAPKSVKWPVDYVVSSLRLLGMQAKTKYLYLAGGQIYLRGLLVEMGQALLQPPTVFGWDWEEAWLTSGRLLARFAFAMAVITSRDGDRFSLNSAALIDPDLGAPGDIVDAVTDLLGVTDQLTTDDRQVLIDYLGGPLDLHDGAVRDSKLNGLIGMVLVSPAYQLH